MAANGFLLSAVLLYQNWARSKGILTLRVIFSLKMESTISMDVYMYSINRLAAWLSVP